MVGSRLAVATSAIFAKLAARTGDPSSSSALALCSAADRAVSSRALSRASSNLDFDAQRPGRLLNRDHLSLPGKRIPEHRDPTQPRECGLQQLQELSGDLREVEKHPGDVPARPGQCRDEPSGHGVRFAVVVCHDRERPGRRLRRPDGDAAAGVNHVDLVSHQGAGHLADIGSALGRVVVEPIVLAFRVAFVLQLYVEGREVLSEPVVEGDLRSATLRSARSSRTAAPALRAAWPRSPSATSALPVR